MSWIEKIKEGIVITCGDGESYEPLYMITEKRKDYNIAEFNFPGVKGTLVKRGTHRGARYNLEIIFQGENHLDVREAFEKSADDRRTWTISHPFYGQLSVHPKGLRFDTKGLNTSIITGEIIETISDDYPKGEIDPQDFANNQASTVNESNVESFSNNVTLQAGDINSLGDQMDDIENETGTNDISESQANEYLNAYNEAKSNILDGAQNTVLAAQSIVDFITAVANFDIPVDIRISILKAQFYKLMNSIDDLESPTEKKIYETNSGAILTAIAQSAINPIDTDYETITEVDVVINDLVEINNQYITNLDALQTINGGELNSYLPDFTFISSLSTLINFTLSQLFVIAVGAQQQRRYVLSVDSNPIILSHRFYGPSEDDSNLDRFISQNNIGINEILQLKKGREVIYYV
jgi:hypothetical protein